MWGRPSPDPPVLLSQSEPAPDPPNAVQKDHALFIVEEFVVVPGCGFAEYGAEPLVPVGCGILCPEHGGYLPVVRGLGRTVLVTPYPRGRFFIRHPYCTNFVLIKQAYVSC